MKFASWNDKQRLLVMGDMLTNINSKHFEALREVMDARKRTVEKDIIRALPRVLFVYIFSFLDPRSLCRCAQVRTNVNSPLVRLFAMFCTIFSVCLNLI